MVSRFPRKWYQEQQLLWAQYQKDHPTDPAGYFQNLRALQYLGLENSPVVPTTIERMKELLPEAPATQLISHWTEGKPMPDMASFWQTNREELLELGLMGPMITLAGYTGDKALQGEQLKAWDLTSSTSSNLLFLHHNLLHSVSKHGFLIVHDEELYWSLLSIQQQFEYRADVEVIFSNMLSDASYRELLQQQYGLITDFSDEGTDIVNHYLSDTDLNALKFIVANPDKNIHLPLWSKTLASNLRNQPIYVVGLTMQLSETDLDNLAIIRERLENEFYLDYLKVDFSPPTTYDAATPFERHYLVPMFLLVRQLDEAGESQEADAWWFLMKKIWKRLGNEDPLEQEINRASFADVFATLKYESVEGRYLDNIKAFDKNIKPIGNGLYAYVYETSNVDYGLWLQHLEDQGEASALAAAKPKLSGEQAEEWSTVSPYYFQNHPAFDNYPVVGISHRAAVAYCEWLTAIYNQTPRREFERVRFRLPTEEEWFEAAAWIEKFRSKDNPNEIVLEGPRVSLPKGETRIVDIDNYDFRFPWWDYFYPEPAMAMASTGCWGGNFNVMDIGCGDHKGDGGKYTVEVTKQWPNEYGLIHISGNVAEMIDQPGVAKGGSWGHTPEESYLMLQQRYSGTDYRVGFRVFMEVIEK
ncbi:MAG: SUMF1/EgtB/PvdO family nonheme iron enzyme [Bacteroidota bacterium]